MTTENSENDPAFPGGVIRGKMFYKIREVAKIVGVKPHVLRYWESEFPSLRPQKNRSGQRIYTQKDIDHAVQIQKLLHVERFSIAGARQHLKKKRKQASVEDVQGSKKKDLEEIHEMLEKQVEPGV